MTSLPGTSSRSVFVDLRSPAGNEKRRVLNALSAGLSPGGGASPIIEHWRRSLTLGVDPAGPDLADDGVGDHDLRTRALEQTSAVSHGAREILDGFARTCSAADHVAVLADPSGVIASAKGGGAFEGEARALRLVDGAMWDEALRGTNAIGTALATGHAVRVDGAAHFARVNEGLVCTAAPILDPSGEIVAVLDATSRHERGGALDPAVVILAVRAIEEILRARAYAGAAGGIELVESLVERASGAALLVERPGRIVRANRAARALAKDTGERMALPPFEELARHAGRGRVVLESPTGAVHVQVEAVLATLGTPSSLLVFVDAVPAGAMRQPAATEPSLAPFRGIIGSDAALDDARRRAARLAKSQLPVLLLAETGTGKELFARAVHDASHRRDCPFVAVNCGAIQPDLMLAELFGHGPQAFTGASRGGRDGRLAAADGGTIFLDEVADLATDAQVALLRFLESGAFRRVGESAERHLDVRIIAATSRDLRAMVATGAFRDDLYYRIGGATISIPPLRDRTDVAELASAIWASVEAPSGEARPDLSRALLEEIAARPWPGNVRELKSALTYAAVMADGEPEARPEHLPAAGALPPVEAEHTASPGEGSGAVLPAGGAAGLEELRRAALCDALREAKGNVSRAARSLGVARSTVYRLARRFEIDLKG